MTEKVEAYCMKCKAKRTMSDAKLETKKAKGTTRYMLMGKCEKCGCKMCKFISPDDAKKWK